MNPPGPSPAESNPETLSGLVERVTYRNEDTGFSVLRLKARGHRQLVTAVLSAPEISPGEWVALRGQWKNDPRHGPQFQASAFEITRPDTLEGIEKYLGSGLIHGIGPHYAKRLVKAFGRDVFDVIESRSAMLLKVEGIGPTRRESIKKAWDEQKTVREIMTFLFSHGVSTARAYRIYKIFGQRAIERIRLDPYCLAREIHGIGFKTADAIAARVGVEKESLVRARAGVEYVLDELTADGHCAFPRPDLLEQAREILDIPGPIVEKALEQTLAEGRLVQRPNPDGAGDDWIYPAPLDAAETGLARHLDRLRRGRHPLDGIRVDAAVAWVQERIRLQLDDQQLAALRAALTDKVLVVTGGPGVGKTTLVRSIIQVYLAKKLRVRLCAPTGRAARRLSEMSRIEAKTVHRLLLYDPGKNGFAFNEDNPIEGDLFVVDEASMMDLALSFQFARSLPSRAALVIVGDVDQLPSVGPGAVLKDVIDSGAIPVARLTKVFRQAARSHIVTNAHRINEGFMPEFCRKGEGTEPGDFYFAPVEDKDKAVDTIARYVRDSIPGRFGFDPMEDIQVLTPMQKGELGARNLNAVLQRTLNPDGPSLERFGVIFRKGDRVMQTENNYDKDVFNGDIGRIASINEDLRLLHVKFDDRLVEYTFMDMDELVHAYAITIHKSQGSEYPCVVLPFHTQHFVMLQRNLLYTAVTRGKRLVVMVGAPRAIQMAVHRIDSRRRYTSLRQRLAALAR